MHGVYMSSLHSLIKLLAPYDVGHLLSSIAGLQLFPRNADQAVRLEVLAHAAVSLPFADGKPQISSGRLRQVCESHDLAAFEHAEDPCDEMFVEEIPFFGGSFRVLPGITESGAFILHHLSQAIFLNTVRFPDRAFIHSARQLIGSALAISNEIARRAGIVRGTPPVSAFGEPIVVPDASTLARLRSAVEFEGDELAQLLHEQHIALSSIKPYLQDLGESTTEKFQIGAGPLHARPIVCVGNKYVAALPSSFLAAARHAIILTAGENGIIRKLAERYCGSVWNTVKEALGLLRHNELHIGTPPGWQSESRTDAIFAFDADKVLYVMLATDPLTDYLATDIYGHWAEPQLRDDVQSRIVTVEQEIFGHLPWVNDLLVLFLFESVGRSSMLGFTQLPAYSRFLAMTASDLNTIALLEVGDSLALWKYAGAARKLHDKTHIIVTSELDEFDLFRASGHSYYIGDDALPDVLTIPPGRAGNLKREVAQARDWHAAPSFRRGYVRQVTAIHDTNSIPIYAPYPLDSRFSLLVEGLPAYVWVVAPAEIPAEQEYLPGLYRTLIDGLAYWIWQFTPILRDCLAGLGREVILVELAIIPDEGWEHKKDYTDTEMAASFSVDARPGNNSITITIGAALTSILRTADNSGERKIIEILLQGFAQLLPEEDRNRPSKGAIRAAINKFAPLGPKKKLLFLSLDNDPQLDNRDIPHYRRNQEADVSEVLDHLGAHLSQKYTKGPIPREQSNEVLKESVRFFVTELEKLVQSFSSEGLLEYLIIQHEAVVRERAFSRLTLPTRLACYGSESELQKQLEDEIPSINHAALAGRFLIELTAAIAPHGLRPICLACFDQMRALSMEIINDGMLSDLVHFKLSELKLWMLPSGRRGINAGEYRTALESYMGVFAAEQLSQSSKSFSHYWTKRKAQRSEFLDNLDVATKAEFGHSLSDMLTFLWCIINLGHKVSAGVASMERTELLRNVSATCDLSEASAASLFELFALKPRNSLFQVQPPFRPEDAYPWRFNRSLSYLRRPLIVRKTENGEEVLWGSRHVEDAGRYLVQICVSGRLRAQSAELRALVGQIHHKDGADFNEKVGHFFSTLPGMLVRKNFKKLKTATELKRPPGDIDVLLADTIAKKVYPIECKNLSVARTPFELATEINEMLGTAGSKSMVEKHGYRVEWCRTHLKDILHELHTDSRGRWSLQPMVVVAQPVLTSHLRQSPIPIFTFDQLKRMFEFRSHLGQSTKNG